MKKLAIVSLALISFLSLEGCSDKITKSYKSDDGKTLDISLITKKSRWLGENEEGYPAVYISTDSIVKMYSPSLKKSLYLFNDASKSDSNLVDKVATVDSKGLFNHKHVYGRGEAGTEKGFEKADTAFRKGVNFVGNGNASSLASEMKPFDIFNYK